jgi:hypothetical protein
LCKGCEDQPTCEFVCPDNALDVPVGPEEVVVNDGQGEGVGRALGFEHDVLVLAVKVRVGDVVLEGNKSTFLLWYLPTDPINLKLYICIVLNFKPNFAARF